jgi:hypothetical protein
MVLRVRKAGAENIHQYFGDGRRGGCLPRYTTRLVVLEYVTFLTMVPLDEVESLTAARAGAISGREPSDALRVCAYPPCIIYTYSLQGRQCLAHTTR